MLITSLFSFFQFLFCLWSYCRHGGTSIFYEGQFAYLATLRASKEALAVEKEKHKEMKEVWAKEKALLEEKVKELEETNKILQKQLEQRRDGDEITTLQESNYKELEANTIAALHSDDKRKAAESHDLNVETTSEITTHENKALKPAENQNVSVESAELLSLAMKEADKMSTTRPPTISLTSTSKSLLIIFH